MLRHALCLSATLVATAGLAAAETPAAGSYGFDWLKPDSARCVALTETVIRGFRSCEFKPDGTFGLGDPAFACRRNASSEYLVYASKATCTRNLETMRAHAP
ncbi:MAG TPA: hypothetical protein VF096_00135 [Azonexus sp.]